MSSRGAWRWRAAALRRSRVEHGSIVDIGSLFEAVKRAPFPENERSSQSNRRTTKETSSLNLLGANPSHPYPSYSPSRNPSRHRSYRVLGTCVVLTAYNHMGTLRFHPDSGRGSGARRVEASCARLFPALVSAVKLPTLSVETAVGGIKF